MNGNFQDKPHLLIVDDDDRLRALLKKFLSEQGFMVTAAASAIEARRKMAWFVFDLVILDVMMPGESGLEFLASLKNNPAQSVLMLSAMGQPDDRIKGLEIGAEDYVSKPFEPKELVLRIKTILRRNADRREKDNSVAFGNFRFNLATSELRQDGEIVYLTSSEAGMLKKLAEKAGTPVAREELAALMSGGQSERSVDVQVNRLRKKIEPGDKPRFLQTVRGKGYVLYTMTKEVV